MSEEKSLIEVARKTMVNVKRRWAQDSNNSYAAGFVDGYDDGYNTAMAEPAWGELVDANEETRLRARIAELEAQAKQHEEAEERWRGEYSEYRDHIQEADAMVSGLHKRIAELEAENATLTADDRWERMYRDRDKRVAELEAQLAAHEAKRFHSGKQVLGEYAARPVQGVVVSEEMVETYRKAQGWAIERPVIKAALTAALSSAKIVPLASAEPARFMCLGRNITHTDSGDGYDIPLYRGFPEAPNGND